MASDVNNALAAKAKAMYGRRITPQNYRELLRKQTVNEVAAYLKQQTNYAGVLKDINENLVHRGQLENIIRNNDYDDYLKFFHFIGATERKFFEHNIVRMEITQILACLRYLNAGRQGKYIFSMPDFLARLCSFDFYGLARVKSMQDLLDLLKNTPYFGILKKYEAGSDGKIDTILLEVELWQYYYKGVLASISKSMGGQNRGKMRKAFGMEIDLENLMIILRLKKYFNASPEYIRSLLLPFYFKVSRQEMDGIIVQPDADSVWKAITSTYYGQFIKKYSYETIEKYTEQIKYDFQRGALLLSDSAPVIVLAYMQLKRTEIDNLIHIIEGIRYSLSPAEIGKLLVGAGV